MNRNCFLKGVMVGKMLKARNAGAAAPATSSAPSSAADYDKSSFLAGIAVGMSTRGALRWPSVASIIYTRESTTDEMLVELYILDMLGRLHAPKLPGMYHLQQWLQENSFTDPEEYANRFNAYGDEIAWSFYNNELELRVLSGLVLPAPLPKDYIKSAKLEYSWFYYPFSGSYYDRKYVASVTVKDSISSDQTEHITEASFAMPDSIPGEVEGGGSLQITLHLPKCKIRLSCIRSSPCTPEPLENGSALWAGIQITWPYNRENFTISNRTAGVKVNSYNTTMVCAFPPGNSVDITMKSHGDLVFNSIPISSTSIGTSLGAGMYSGDVLFEANTSYSASIVWSAEILEIYDVADEGNATLTEVLRSVDSAGLYYMSDDNGETLKPLLMIDQDTDVIRDRDRIRVDQRGNIYPYIQYRAKNVVQNNSKGSITVSANTADADYLHEFDEFDSDNNIVKVTESVGRVQYKLNETGKVGMTLYTGISGTKGNVFGDGKTYTIRRVDGA